MKRCVGVMVLACMFGGADGWVAAETVTISYVGGSADVRDGDSWTPLSIGDTVPTDATIRLEEGSTLSFDLDGNEVTLSDVGTYALTAVVAASRSLRSPGTAEAVASTMSRFLTGPEELPTTAAGVMGGSENGGTGSAAGYFEEARRDLTGGSVDAAIDRLNAAIEAAAAQDVPLVRFTLAYAYSLKGYRALALYEADQVPVRPADAWAGDFVILKGRLLLETDAFPDAVAWLRSHAEEGTASAQTAPLYDYLLGVSYEGTGDDAHAAESLKEAADSGGRIGAIAGAELDHLRQRLAAGSAP